MGDSNILIAIHLDSKKRVYTHKAAADSALADLMKTIDNNILIPHHSTGDSTNQIDISTHLSIFDCTYHPPKDITSTVLQYDQCTGPKSITLQKLGFWPGGKIAICERSNEQVKKSITTSQIHWTEDINHEFNTPGEEVSIDTAAAAADNTTRQVSSVESIKPSEVLESVKDRFKTDQNDSSNQQLSPSISISHQAIRRKGEEDRCNRISLRIRELDKRSKKKDNVSEQVRRMLVKSKSKGDTKIRQEDRLYLETLIVIDSFDTSGDANAVSVTEPCHRFFSRFVSLSRVIKVATSDIEIGSDKMVELLVSMKTVAIRNNLQVDDDYNEYGRISGTLHLHEAEEAGFIYNFDRVIVRIFENKSPNALTKEAPLWLEELKQSDIEIDINTSSSSGAYESQSQIAPYDDDHAPQQEVGYGTSHINTELYSAITKSIKEMDEESKRKKGKKSKTSEKVRQMIMKSKSKGDKKNIKETNRFYADVVTLHPKYNIQSSTSFSQASLKASSMFICVSKMNIIGEIKRIGSSIEGDALILTQQKEDCIILEENKRIVDAEKQGILSDFDRIIIMDSNIMK